MAFGRRRWGWLVLAVLAVGCSTANDAAPSSTAALASAPGPTGRSDPTSAPLVPGTSEPPATTCPTTAPTSPDPTPDPTDTDGIVPDRPQPEQNQAPLVAVDARTGQVRWRVCPGPWAYSDVTVAGGVVLVRGRSFEFAGHGTLPCGQPVEPVLLALSAADGGVIWASDDQRSWAYYLDPPTPNTTDGVVLVEDPGPDPAKPVPVTRAVDATTGAPRWEAPGTVNAEVDHVVFVNSATEPGPIMTVARDRRTGVEVPGASLPTTSTTLMRSVERHDALEGPNREHVTINAATVALTEADGRERWSYPPPPFVTEVRGVTADTVFVAGGLRVGNCP